MKSYELIELSYNDSNPGIITKLKVEEGSKVTEEDIFCIYRTKGEWAFTCAIEGVVRKIFVSVEQPVKFGDKLALIERCSAKPVRKNNVSAGFGESDNNQICREFFKKKLGFQASLVSRFHPLLLGKMHMNDLLNKKKLALIVDLDNTIIHSAKFEEPTNFKDVFQFQRMSNGPFRHVKMRPHTDRFLANISNYYELYIFTLGTKSYAKSIVKQLDPLKTYFQERILSIEDSTDGKHKFCNLKHMFPAGDNMVCIIDDNEYVWNSIPNLMRAKSYTYFDENANDSGSKYMGKFSAVSAKNYSVTNDQSEEAHEETDNYLIHLENVLIKIHSQFYKKYEKNPQSLGNGELDLKKIVPQRKRKVLKDCNIFFSDVVIPKHNLKDSWAYRLAVNYGASVQTSLVVVGPEKTTHIVGLRECRREEEMARKHNIAMVSIDWLIDSIEKWKRVDDTLYPISKGSSRRYVQYKNFKGCMKL